MTEVIAHRGASAHAPENTLRAFRAAIEAGAHRVELDVQSSADGVPFVFHDIELTRLCGVREVACGESWDALASLHVLADAYEAGDDTRIPSLDDVITTIGSRIPLYVEIKPGGAGRHEDDWRTLTDACIDRVDAPHVLASFSVDVVRRCLEAGRPSVLIASDPRRLGDLTAREREGLHAFSVLHERIDAKLVRRCAQSGLALWAWTVDRPSEFQRLRTLGADSAWCTNDPAALRAWLDGRR